MDLTRYGTNDCNHRRLRYPNAVPKDRYECRQCLWEYQRPAWMQRFTTEELSDIQLMFELLALRIATFDTPRDHPEYMTQREGRENQIALLALHGYDLRKDEIAGTWRRFQREVQRV